METKNEILDLMTEKWMVLTEVAYQKNIVVLCFEGGARAVLKTKTEKQAMRLTEILLKAESRRLAVE